MNDSGFWVVARLIGLTEKETVKSWTMAVTVNTVVGLVTCLLLSVVLPFRPGEMNLKAAIEPQINDHGRR